MKSFFLIIFLLFMTACSNTPSEASIQTAIAQTQAAQPTNTPAVIPTAPSADETISSPENSAYLDPGIIDNFQAQFDQLEFSFYFKINELWGIPAGDNGSYLYPQIKVLGLQALSTSDSSINTLKKDQITEASLLLDIHTNYLGENFNKSIHKFVDAVFVQNEEYASEAYTWITDTWMKAAVGQEEFTQDFGNKTVSVSFEKRDNQGLNQDVITVKITALK